MKKVIFILAAVALMASCNKKGEGCTPMEDSLSNVYGTLAGYGIKQQVTSEMQMNNESVNFEEFLKGLEKAIATEADTSLNARSFEMGEQIGKQISNGFAAMKEQGVNINKDVFIAELKKAFSEKKAVDQNKMMNLQMSLQALMGKVQAQAAKQKAKEGEKYYQDAEKSGKYKKTAMGVLYKVEKQGKGAKFKKGDNVMLKYKGMHVDGKVFDHAQQAVPFPVDETQIIKGFVDMLVNMSPGMKVTCIIPAKVAYGEGGSQNIMPGETLVFEIETVGMAPAEKAAPAPAPAPAAQK